MDVVDGPAPREVPRAVTDAFRFAGPAIGSEPLRGGHIHQNFLVTCTGGRYVLQRLNDRVFPDIDAVLHNVERVVAHLEEARPENPGAGGDRAAGVCRTGRPTDRSGGRSATSRGRWGAPLRPVPPTPSRRRVPSPTT